VRISLNRSGYHPRCTWRENTHTDDEFNHSTQQYARVGLDDQSVPIAHETYTDFVLQDLIVHKGDYATKAYGQRK